jgi:fluoride ion exporter CrcB/FEX
LGKRFKAPLQLKNEHEWMSLLSEADNYIRSLQKLDGTSILSSRVKTGFLGFLCGISTFQNIFDDLVRNGPLNYVITYKFSQVLKMIV